MSDSSSNNTKRAKESPSRVISSREEMLDALDRNGYVVLPNLLDEETCEQLYESFWDYLETMNPKLDRSDRSTWKKHELPLNTKGLIQHYNVGFQRFTVDAHMALKPVFQELYQTSKLWTSFDGICFTQKGPRPRFKDVGHWKTLCWEQNSVHIDQTTPGFISVQGGLAVTNQPEDQHVFLCVPGSHKHHEELLKIWEEDALERYEEKLASYNGQEEEEMTKKPKLEKPELHWMIMNRNQLAYLRKQGLEMKRIPLTCGSFVLWDSRCVHSSATYCASAPADAMRLQIFVCMRPAPSDPLEIAKEMKVRQEAYKQGRVSKHSADHIRLFGKQPRIYCMKDKETHEKMKIPPSIPLTKEEEELYGLRTEESGLDLD